MPLITVDLEGVAATIEHTGIIADGQTYHVFEIEAYASANKDVKAVVAELLGNQTVIHVIVGPDDRLRQILVCDR